jgi:hypothetical protein
MKTKMIKLIALVAFVLTPVAIFAQEAAGAESALALSSNIVDILTKVAVWYGIACAGLNGLTVLVSGIVKRTPGTSDDEAVDKFYASKPYKAVAWIFSWGDYIGELVAKLKR